MASFSDSTFNPTAESIAGALPEAPLQWVNPCKINLVARLTQDKKKQMLLRKGEAIDGDWDKPHNRRFDEFDTFLAIKQRFVLGRGWEETNYYKRVITEINAGVPKWHCTSESEFRARCARLDEIYNDIQQNGYKTQIELRSEKLPDDVRVGIRRDGQYIFLDGQHRLAMARVLGLPNIPVRVVARHSEWVTFKSEITAFAAERGGQIYELIDHPDLADLPSQHRGERMQLLLHALSSYECPGKRLLDIGTHWGYMCQQMEKLGFSCTGIEADKRYAYFAERIRVATDSQFKLWQGDFLDFPDVESQDVVLALSIFHHLIKTEALHNALISFLRKLRATLIIFQPHVSDPPGQMDGAFRNYNPNEFAKFVADHAKMNTIECVGKAHDGRLIFKLTP